MESPCAWHGKAITTERADGKRDLLGGKIQLCSITRQRLDDIEDFRRVLNIESNEKIRVLHIGRLEM